MKTFILSDRLGFGIGFRSIPSRGNYFGPVIGAEGRVIREYYISFGFWKMEAIILIEILTF